MRTIFARVVQAFLLASLTVALASGADWPQWRGPNRDGISRETGLLKEWPKDGPQLVWQSREAGRGYSTPAVEGSYLYLMGNEGLENEFVRALKVKDGKTAWTTSIGRVGNPDQQPNFPTARSTPTIDGKHIYALGSDGDLVCLEKQGGKPVWKKNLRTDFEGKPGTWAYSESPLVDGDRVVCTPGGPETSLVALDKKTGNPIWKCSAAGAGVASYSSIVVADIGGTRQYVQLMQKGLVGVAAKDGKFLWRWDKPVSKYGANIPTPVVHGDEIYAGAAGTGGGLVRLRTEDGAFKPDQVYFTPKMPAGIGSTVLIGGSLYGNNAHDLLCLDFKTGEVKWENPSIGAVSITFAEGLLYTYGENGQMALVEATPKGYQEKGRFTPPGHPSHSNDMEKSWAYPVVSGGRLYLRDHEVLWCYDVKRR